MRSKIVLQADNRARTPELHKIDFVQAPKQLDLNLNSTRIKLDLNFSSTEILNGLSGIYLSLTQKPRGLLDLFIV